MPTITLTTETNVTERLIWDRVLEGASAIESVTVTPASGTQYLTHTFNPETKALRVSMVGAPSTSSTPVYTNYPLVNQGTPDQYGNVYCNYGPGGGEWSRYGCSPSRRVQTGTNTRFDYVVTVVYSTNSKPTLTLETTDNRTLYENDTFNLTGSYNDADAGNVISVKYSVNNGTARALASAISDGSAKSFNRVLTYRNNKLYDSLTVLTSELAEGAQHVVKVWAEDDKGGKSAEQLRVFYVVANRAPTLTASMAPLNGQIETDTAKFTGNVADPDGNAVKVEYRIRNGSFVEVYNGNGGPFEFTFPLSSLNSGTNAITIRATDSYGATTNRTFSVQKKWDAVPLKHLEKRYKITPPNGSAQGLLAWIQREVGDLDVTAEISVTAAGEPENFVPMVWQSTANVNGSVQEDELMYEFPDAKNHIVVNIKGTRNNPASTAGILLVNGVLS